MVAKFELCWQILYGQKLALPEMILLGPSTCRRPLQLLAEVSLIFDGWLRAYERK